MARFPLLETTIGAVVEADGLDPAAGAEVVPTDPLVEVTPPVGAGAVLLPQAGTELMAAELAGAVGTAVLENVRKVRRFDFELWNYIPGVADDGRGGVNWLGDCAWAVGDGDGLAL